MPNHIKTYTFQDREIRTVELDGVFWFLGTDILKTLFGTDIGRWRAYLALKDTQRRIVLRETLGFPAGKNMTIISTVGVDAILSRSRKPIARDMRYWLRAVDFPRCAELTELQELRHIHPPEGVHSVSAARGANTQFTNSVQELVVHLKGVVAQLENLTTIRQT